MLTPNPCHPDPSLFASIWVAPTALILHTMDSCEEVILLWTRLPYLPFLPLHRFPGKRLPLLYLVYTLCPKKNFTSFEFRISVWPPWTGYQRPPLTATHAAEVVTPPTLWCCTIQKEPCLLLEFLNLDPTEINTAVLSQFILPPHSCVTKIGLPDTKKQVSCKFLSLLAWLGGNHSAPLKVPPYRNFLNIAGGVICNT